MCGGEANEMDVSSCHSLFGLWCNTLVLRTTINCSKLRGPTADLLSAFLFSPKVFGVRMKGILKKVLTLYPISGLLYS